jgi:hypothetical protein
MMTVKPRVAHQIMSSPINYRRCLSNTAVADNRTVTINTMITRLPVVADVTDYTMLQSFGKPPDKPPFPTTPQASMENPVASYAKTHLYRYAQCYPKHS